MKLGHLVQTLNLCFLASEVALSVFRRSKGGAQQKDRGSLWVLWGILFTGVWLGIFATKAWPATHLPDMRAWQIVGCGLMVMGLALRWWAILYLGRFFTVNVAVHAQHRVVDAGPYRHVRHPSYTGALLSFLGLSLGLGSWVSILLIMIPAWLAYGWRMRVEEQALGAGLGENYLNYTRRTKRLLPFVY